MHFTLGQVHVIAAQPQRWLIVPDTLLDAVRTYARRAADMEPQIREFMFVIPKARCAGFRMSQLSVSQCLCRYEVTMDCWHIPMST